MSADGGTEPRWARNGLEFFYRNGDKMMAVAVSTHQTFQTATPRGSLEESVTVSGQTPVIDVQSATQQQVLTRELLDAVPTGRSIWAVGGTLTGVTLSEPDVDGSRGMQQTYMAVHGSERRDNAIQVDGMSVAGLLDVQAADAQPRLPGRAVQHVRPRRRLTGRPVRAVPPVRQDRESVQLEGLGAAPRRRL